MSASKINPRWLIYVPELETRETLLSNLPRDEKLRRKLFHIVDTLENVALIPKKSVAIRCIDLIWKEIRKDLLIWGTQHLPESNPKNHILFAELFGCCRNVMLNMHLKSGRRIKKIGKRNIRRKQNYW